MKSNRYLALILSILLILSFCLIGSGCDSASSGGTSSGSSTPQGESTAPSASSTALDPNDFPNLTIRYDTPFGATHPFSQIDQVWMDDLQEQANISVEPYYSSTLVSASTPYQEVLSGVADAVYAINGSEADHFYIANAVQVFCSWGTSVPRSVYETVCQLLEQCTPLQAEYEGIVPYGIRTSGQPLFLITKEPVRTMDDLKGMTIRVANDSMAAVVDAFGGEPLRLEVPEMMEALEKGIIDGVMLPAESLESMNFAEPCKYATATNLVDPFGVEKYISEDTYNKFSDAQKTAFKNIGKEIDSLTMQINKELETSAFEFGKEHGVEFITLPEGDYARIDQALSDYAAQLIRELNDKGYDGQEIYDLTRSLLEENIAVYG